MQTVHPFHILTPPIINILELLDTIQKLKLRINQFGSDIEVNMIGLEHEVMFYECQIMAIISELYFIMTGQAADPKEKLTERNKDKFAGFAMHGARCPILV